MLRTGDHVPHFDVLTIDGTRAVYSSIWQQKNLVLVCLPQQPAPAERAYVDGVAARLSPDDLEDTALVFTREEVTGLERPSALVADRWGEVQVAAAGPSVEALPDPAEIGDWVRHVRSRCPECEGEAR